MAQYGKFYFGFLIVRVVNNQGHTSAQPHKAVLLLLLLIWTFRIYISIYIYIYNTQYEIYSVIIFILSIYNISCN